MAIRVFLADDHRLLVEGFRHALKDLGVDVIGIAHTLEGLMQRYETADPDVLIIDVRFDSKQATKNGLDFCEELLESHPDAKIIVFSQFEDQYLIEKAYKMGVLAFIRKDEDTEVLFSAIQSVAEGREFFSPNVAQILAWHSIKEKNPSKLLDEKELRVFAMTADGVPQAKIAEEMDVSERTVASLVKNVKAALGIENPADFTKLAIRFGITTLDVKTRS